MGVACCILHGLTVHPNEPSSRQETGHPLAEWVKHIAFPRRESTGVAPTSQHPEYGASTCRVGKYIAWCMMRLHSSTVHPDELSSRQKTRHPEIPGIHLQSGHSKWHGACSKLHSSTVHPDEPSSRPETGHPRVVVACGVMFVAGPKLDDTALL